MRLGVQPRSVDIAQHTPGAQIFAQLVQLNGGAPAFQAPPFIPSFFECRDGTDRRIVRFDTPEEKAKFVENDKTASARKPRGGTSAALEKLDELIIANTATIIQRGYGITSGNASKYFLSTDQVTTCVAVILYHTVDQVAALAHFDCEVEAEGLSDIISEFPAGEIKVYIYGGTGGLTWKGDSCTLGTALLTALAAHSRHNDIHLLGFDITARLHTPTLTINAKTGDVIPSYPTKVPKPSFDSQWRFVRESNGAMSWADDKTQPQLRWNARKADAHFWSLVGKVRKQIDVRPSHFGDWTVQTVNTICTYIEYAVHNSGKPFAKDLQGIATTLHSNFSDLPHILCMETSLRSGAVMTIANSDVKIPYVVDVIANNAGHGNASASSSSSAPLKPWTVALKEWLDEGMKHKMYA